MADDPLDIIRQALRPERWAKMERALNHRLGAVRVVIENLHHPHNLSAVMRTCEGLGVQHLHVVDTRENTVPSRRITLGAHKWLAIHRHDRFEECGRDLKTRGFRLYAAMLDPGAVALEEIPVDAPVALLFGNERDGVSPEARAWCDGAYTIPMYGFVQSFNVSVAVAVSLYSVTQRVRQRPDGGLLTAEERREVLGQWLPKSLRFGRRLVRGRG